VSEDAILRSYAREAEAISGIQCLEDASSLFIV